MFSHARSTASAGLNSTVGGNVITSAVVSGGVHSAIYGDKFDVAGTIGNAIGNSINGYYEQQAATRKPQ